MQINSHCHDRNCLTERCPLWVKSGHVWRTSPCPLSAKSGHAGVSWIATVTQAKDQVLAKARPQALCIRPRVL